MLRDTTRFSRCTNDYVDNVCREVFQMDSEDIEDLVVGIQNEMLDKDQEDVMLSLIENARLVDTYFPGGDYGYVASEIGNLLDMIRMKKVV